jgi:hypothetical protein
MEHGFVSLLYFPLLSSTLPIVTQLLVIYSIDVLKRIEMFWFFKKEIFNNFLTASENWRKNETVTFTYHVSRVREGSNSKIMALIMPLSHIFCGPSCQIEDNFFGGGDRDLIQSLGWPWTHYPPALASWVPRSAQLNLIYFPTVKSINLFLLIHGVLPEIYVRIVW